MVLVPPDATTLLDVGCSVGALGAELKKSRDITVYGIEMDTEMAAIASGQLDQVVCGNAETLDFAELIGESGVDCIIFADILEHLTDPWRVLRDAVDHLTETGTVIISIPNIRHFTALVNLMFRGDWPRRDRGLFDATHLRWFTLKNLRELCAQAGLTIADVRRSYRILDRPNDLNRFACLLGWWPFREFVAYQYVIVARRQPRD